MTYDTIIVGGGLSGLTTAAYLSQAGLNVLLCEKEKTVGGLLSSFNYNGFTFDAGARAIENSGVLIPMLHQLGINLTLLPNPVSLGIEQDIIQINTKDSLEDYAHLLKKQFPNDISAIDQLIQVIKKVMSYMDILYGIENPLFMDLKNDKTYLKETLIPWLFKYILTLGKIKRFNQPIDEYLETITDNPILIDMIAQHFFAKTPAFFALSYFSLYLDYQYPKGGTGSLIEALRSYIILNGGTIKNETTVTAINVSSQTIQTNNNNEFKYKQLIWCADTKALYAISNTEGLRPKERLRINQYKQIIKNKRGGDSVLTLFATSNIDASFFSSHHTAHFFYTPVKKGIGMNPINNIKNQNGGFINSKEKLFKWIKEYLTLTTFEISIPCLRDHALAPEEKTGLIISTLFNYDLVEHLRHLKLYDEAKLYIAKIIITLLSEYLYPNFESSIESSFISTPYTIASLTGNSDGAITGWSFTDGKTPAISEMPKIAKSVITPMPNILQAGQWTYSPSGLPISMLTGKLAANRAIKKISRQRQD